MTVLEVGAFTASLISVTLAIVAIWLSVCFYKMSSQLSEGTKEAAHNIGASVERLEKLFDKLYADTFSMMKETVSDMRHHIWPDEEEASSSLSEEADERAQAREKELRQQIDQQLSALFKRQSVTDVKVSSLREELGNIVDHAIRESRKVEITAREDTLRDHILTRLQQMREKESPTTAYYLVFDEKLRKEFSKEEIAEELRRMKNDGLLVPWDDDKWGPKTNIRLAK